MSGLFRSRRTEHRKDEAIRKDTAETLVKHRESLHRVRRTLTMADETLADEIKRLESLVGNN